MNGRMYDPRLGRFLSPDNYVQAPDLTQNFNRYTYALNNPLMYTDPDGEWINIAIGAVVGATVNLIANWEYIDNVGEGIVIGLAGAVGGAVSGALCGLDGGAALLTTVTVCAGIAAVNNIVQQTNDMVGLNKVDWGQVGESALIGGVCGGIGYYVGGLTGNLSTEIGAINGAIVDGLTGAAVGGLTGGVMGGVIAEIYGENFWDGFESGFKSGAIYGGISGAVSGAISGINNANKLGVDKITGGTLDQRAQAWADYYGMGKFKVSALNKNDLYNWNKCATNKKYDFSMDGNTVYATDRQTHIKYDIDGYFQDRAHGGFYTKQVVRNATFGYSWAKGTFYHEFAHYLGMSEQGAYMYGLIYGGPKYYHQFQNNISNGFYNYCNSIFGW